jgi:hypothetical protein
MQQSSLLDLHASYKENEVLLIQAPVSPENILLAGTNWHGTNSLAYSDALAN